MAETIDTGSSVEQCPDCGSSVEKTELTDVDGATATCEVTCTNCEFEAVEAWSFEYAERKS